MRDIVKVPSASLLEPRSSVLACRRGAPGHAAVVPAAFGQAVPGQRPCEIIPFPLWDEAPQPASRTKVLFVCRTHAALGPMASGLARASYNRFDVCVESAGLTARTVDPRAIAAMNEVGIDISRTEPVSVRDLELGAFDIVVSLGIHKLGVDPSQMAFAWDVPEFERVTAAAAMSAIRLIRDALSTRVHALGAILKAAGRA